MFIFIFMCAYVQLLLQGFDFLQLLVDGNFLNNLYVSKLPVNKQSLYQGSFQCDKLNENFVEKGKKKGKEMMWRRYAWGMLVMSA